LPSCSWTLALFGWAFGSGFCPQKPKVQQKGSKATTTLGQKLLFALAQNWKQPSILLAAFGPKIHPPATGYTHNDSFLFSSLSSATVPVEAHDEARWRYHHSALPSSTVSHRHDLIVDGP